MSLTDASTRSFLEAEDNFQNKGKVVDMLLDSSLCTRQRTQFFGMLGSSLNRVVMLC